MKIEASQLAFDISANYYESEFSDVDNPIFFGVKGLVRSYCEGKETFGALTAGEAREVAEALKQLADWAESGGFRGDEPQ